MEATVLKWHKKVGDVVLLDETLLDIATDKVDSEVPSTASGVLEEILCKENDVITIGSVIGKIKTDAPEPSIVSAPAFAPSPHNGILSNGASQKQEEIRVPFQPSQMAVPHKQESGRFFSPLVMNIASREGIPFLCQSANLGVRICFLSLVYSSVSIFGENFKHEQHSNDRGHFENDERTGTESRESRNEHRPPVFFWWC